MFDLETIKYMNARAVEKDRRRVRRLYEAALQEGFLDHTDRTEWRKRAANTVRADRRARKAIVGAVVDRVYRRS